MPADTPSGTWLGRIAAHPAWLVLPALVVCTIFIFIPAVLTIIGSFYAFALTDAVRTPVGLGNYVRAVEDPIFWTALRNNVLLVLGSIVLQVGIGTVLAAILDRGVSWGQTFFRVVIFMPMVISTVAVALIWLIILDPNIGILNEFVEALGLTPPVRGWLGDPSVSMWMVLVVAAWQFTGFMMVLILAGIQAIPRELYEAAALDGARGLRAFFSITLPSLRNVLVVAVLITTIGAFKVFDLIYVLTGGGPANATQVLGTYIYLRAFTLNELGYANAIAVVLLAIAVFLGWLQLKASSRT